ncbi:uncharacterized protein LOC132732140 [Ruditapes philippinarum]|uniref:uncharacterized protein LOC132732140 n=1 Tax=Ruditapes philippinarum TaxID=129788 RepID=UPI00295A5D3A|nr:uncharacterized protein LOC132732140 [Ruditapes philippinarum]
MTTGSTYFSSDYMAYQNDVSWDRCINRKSESDANILIERDILPTKNELNMAFRVFGTNSRIISSICSSIRHHMKKDLKKGIDILPSYQADSESVVFLIIIKRVSSFPIFKDYDYFMKCANQYSPEGDIVAKCEIKDRTMNHCDDDIFEQLRKCINENADDLFKMHSNLNVILPSSKKSVGYRSGQHKILEKPCIALYVSVKGYIPLNETPFQTMIDCFQTDVLEGEFEPYMQGPNEYHEDLKIGLAIHANVLKGDDILGGTLGGFIDHSTYGLCGITSAHVVYSDAEMTEVIDKKQLRLRKTVYQPIGGRSSAFGEVVQAVYDEGSRSASGMEVALVQIQSRQPTNGSFPETLKDFEAGFDASNPLCFNSGAVCETSEIKRRTEVYKFGMNSGITRGSFDLQGAALRKGQMQGHQGFGFNLKNQMVVLQIGKNPFAERGDSGALVLIEGEEDSIAIGIVEGGMNGCVFVTPLCDILRAVGCTELKMHRFTPPTCTQSVSDSGVGMEMS